MARMMDDHDSGEPRAPTITGVVTGKPIHSAGGSFWPTKGWSGRGASSSPVAARRSGSIEIEGCRLRRAAQGSVT